MLKRSVLTFGILLLTIILIQPLYSQYKVETVVIDAGHGGKDPGALGSYSREKDIALSIALKTGAYIEEYLPDVEVIYTRKTDVFVELHKRAKIANDNNADLFISIHCNANRSKAPYGSETYIMGLHKSDANLEVAKLENAAILQEDNYADMYQGFDPSSDEDYITLSMFQDAFQAQSTAFAKQVQDQFRERVKIKDRGVKQAGFLVLHQVAMPRVLIETGFLSNSKDENYLNSDDGQSYIASAIYRAFKEYKNEVERVDNKAAPVEVSQDDFTLGAPEIIFRVQIATFASPKPLNYKKFKGADYIMEYYHNGIFKYTAGKFEKIQDAVDYMNELRKDKKFKDCFVVAFKDNERISVDEARSLLKNR
jgi:N-acetylmuramoyl-L-alanine amidase